MEAVSKGLLLSIGRDRDTLEINTVTKGLRIREIRRKCIPMSQGWHLDIKGCSYKFYIPSCLLENERIKL